MGASDSPFSYPGEVHALNASNGALLWRQDSAGDDWTTDSIQPCYDEISGQEAIYHICDGQLAVMDPFNGTTLWTYPSTVSTMADEDIEHMRCDSGHVFLSSKNTFTSLWIANHSVHWEFNLRNANSS